MATLPTRIRCRIRPNAFSMLPRLRRRDQSFSSHLKSLLCIVYTAILRGHLSPYMHSSNIQTSPIKMVIFFTLQSYASIVFEKYVLLVFPHFTRSEKKSPQIFASKFIFYRLYARMNAENATRKMANWLTRYRKKTRTEFVG